MKLASYRAHGRESFGAVIGEGAGEGVVDLNTRLKPRFTSVLDLLRLQGGLDAARETVRGVRADFPLSEVELLPPLRTPEKILCIGINYANRNADYGDAEVPKYPSMFYRAPGSLVGHGQNIVRPRESEQLDYEGEIALVIGRTGRRIAQEQALDACRRRHALQRGHHPRLDPARQVQRHAGQELGRQRQHRPLDRHRRRSRPRQTAASHRQAERRNYPGRHHVEPDQVLCRTDRLCQHLHDAQARRRDRHRHAGQARTRKRSAALAHAGRRGRRSSVPEIGTLRNTVIAEP